MSLATAELPTDPTELHAFALACQGELKMAELSVQYKALEIEKLRLQIAKLRRMQFGHSSKRISRQIEQLELRLEELETGEAEVAAKAEAEADTAEPVAPIRERIKPKRKPLPDHLPRQEVMHQPADDGACKCPDCGKGMAKLGEDINVYSIRSARQSCNRTVGRARSYIRRGNKVQGTSGVVVRPIDRRRFWPEVGKRDTLGGIPRPVRK
jgi:hypothetical protein